MKTFKMLLPGMAILTMVNCAFAQTWTQTSAPSNNWISVASSADGSKLVATTDLGTNIGPIYASTNSGITWTQTSAPSNHWETVASSADGSKLVAIGFDPSYNNVVLTSTDSGMTWTQSSPPNGFFSVASSADGEKLAAVVYRGGIYTSTNSGITWMQTSAPITNWQSIASSADGSKLVAVTGNNSPIFTSTDSGTTWIQNSVVKTNGDSSGWYAVASSADGTKLEAVDLEPFIFTSTDSGMTWTQNSVPSVTNYYSWLPDWKSVAVSADGREMVVGTDFPSPMIYVSTNLWETWTSNNIPAHCVASSADGNKLVAAANLGGIYTLQTTPSPQLNLTPTNGSFKLSWLIPSTNFVMQQSSNLASWSNVTNTPVLNLTNLQNEVILSPTSSSGFYRLKTP
jgi:photosystem II stability/assembly factor-like uncharacterized protein